MNQHVQVFEPFPGLLAFYDGRVDGYRLMDEPNWVDAGAITLGIASYALISGSHAMVYDTHVSTPHAQFIKDTLIARGVTRFTVVLSHWHLDHVAGTQVFADCEIISNKKTLGHLSKHQEDIQDGTLEGLPAISPLILPNKTFEGAMTLNIGTLAVELIEANIHSDDATVVWIKDQSILLAGDTMEDTVTYVAEPAGFGVHLSELARLARLGAQHILPNHGRPEVVRSGGYDDGLIKAQQQYIAMLQRCRLDPDLRAKPLEDLIAPSLSQGWVEMFEPYREVHEENLRAVMALDAGD